MFGGGGGGMGGGGMGGGMLGIGITADQLGGAFSQITGQMHSAKEAEKAWDRTKELNRNIIQWRKRDLALAGINPILAGGMNPSGSTVGAIGAPSGRQPSGGTEAVRAAALLRSQAKMAANSARASELDPMIRYAQLAEQEWSAKSAEADYLLRRAKLPLARQEERFYQHPTGQAVKRWNLMMRNIFGGAPKPTPIYRGK